MRDYCSGVLIELGRINVAARGVGVANAALKEAVAYSQVRRTMPILCGVWTSRCTDTRLHASTRSGISLESLNTTRTPWRRPGLFGGTRPQPRPTIQGTIQDDWGREEPYTLDQLASVIPFNWEPLPSGKQAWAATSIYSRQGCDGLVVERMPACLCSRPCTQSPGFRAPTPAVRGTGNGRD